MTLLGGTMLGSVGRHVRGQFVGYLALFVALGGVSYAAVTLPRNSVGSRQIKNGQVRKADLGKNSVTSAKVKDGAISAADLQAGVVPTTAGGALAGSYPNPALADGAVGTAAVADNSLSGSDIDESTLGTVPSATNAATLGGATLGEIGVGRTATDDSCGTFSSSYVNCVTLSITLPRTQRLLIIGSVDVGFGTSASTNEYAECRLVVDSVASGILQTVGWGGSGVGGTVFPELSVSLNHVTNQLAAGTHSIDIACHALYGDPGGFESQVSVVGLSPE